MPKTQRYIYWDTCVFLDYLRATPERIHDIQAVLGEVQKGSGFIATSIVSRVEVAYWAEDGVFQLDDASEEALDSMWGDKSVFRLVELHEPLTKRARALMRRARSEGWSLKPMDAIHLATAQSVNAVEIHTYDDKWYKFAEWLHCEIKPPSPLQPALM